MSQPKSLMIAIAAFVCLLSPSMAQSQDDQTIASGVAVEFINAYVKAIPGFDSGYESTIKWVSKRQDVTERLKTALAKLYRDALKADPEMGYGADAILSAQDFPDSYRLKSVKVDSKKGVAMVVLVGEAPMESDLRMKLALQDGSWLVDGSGDLMK